MTGRAAKKQKTFDPPSCGMCASQSRLTDGSEIYPHRPDLHAKHFYKCDGCGAYCGCHGNTTEPVGTPADAALRKARMILHNELLDPLWMEADRSGVYAPEDDKARSIIRKAARGRVYRYLAEKLGLTFGETHTGHFDLETCRKAWLALKGVTYADIRAWSKAKAA